MALTPTLTLTLTPTLTLTLTPTLTLTLTPTLTLTLTLPLPLKAERDNQRERGLAHVLGQLREVQLGLA